MTTTDPSARAIAAQAGPKGDSPELAARSLRAIVRAHRTYRYGRVGILAGRVVAAVCTAGAIQQGLFGDPWAGVVLLGAAITAASLTNYAVAMLGVAAMTASATIAACVVLFLGADQDLGWGLRITSLVAVAAATVMPMRARHRRLPVTPTAIVGQWLVPIGLTAAATVGEGVTFSVTAAALLGLWAYQGDLRKWWAARSAARRSRIPMNPGSERAGVIIGLQPPPDMTGQNLDRGIESETATAVELAKLGPEWTVFHSRALPGTNSDVDHIVIGPPGVIVIDSKYRSGELEHEANVDIASASAGTVDVEGDIADYLDRVFGVSDPQDDAPRQVWLLNGSPADSMATAAVFEGACVDDLLDMPEGELVTPVIIAMHGARMSTGHAPMDVYDRGRYRNTVEVVHASELVAYLESLPTLGRPQEFTDDLATVVDYLLPRK
jgi:hypothetical protein